MNVAIARPRDLGVLYMSAHTAPDTVRAQEAPTPAINRKMINAAKLGANAEANMPILKTAKAYIIMIFRPQFSESGPKTSGPTTYPTRYIDVGRISRGLFVISQSFAIYVEALDASPEPIVEFKTDHIITPRM